jgi:PAS domain S-box-containing protein
MMTEKNYANLALNHPTATLWEKMVDEVRDYAFILLDKHGDVVNWNKGAESIKGYSRQEAIGKNFRIFYAQEDQDRNLPEQLIQRASDEGRALHEGWRVRKDGSLFWGSIVMTALHDVDGEVIGFLKITRDLTAQKYSEDMLKEKNQELEKMNQELTSFAYVASHDLQEPLRKIMTFSSRIMEMEKENFSDRSLEYFGRMQSAATRMQTLIQDLLTYSRTTSNQNNKTEPIELNALIEGVMSDLEEIIHEKKAVIKVPALPQVTGIKFQYHQLFFNLIGNALKFSKQGVQPVIEIKYEVVSGDKIKGHKADPKKTYDHFMIIDNGIGFEREYREKIFEVFQRLHGKAEYSGTGIGLSICKKIVENHKGFIHAHGEPDKGATFDIYIPKT